MERILLIISTWSLRQLYHELLLAKHIEVVPSDSIESAILLLTVWQFTMVVIYPNDETQSVVEAFLRLRQKHPNWQPMKVVLLSSDVDFYKPLLRQTDIIINILLDSPIQVVAQIKKQLDWQVADPSMWE